MGRILRAFIGGSWAGLSGIWSAVGGAVGVVVYLVTEKVMAPLYGIALGLYVAVCIAYWTATKNAERLQGRIDALASASPRIKFLKVGGPSAVKLAKRNVEIWQLWFVNDPDVRGSLAVARHLTAEVEFSNARGVRPFDAFVGQWAITQKPDHVGWGGPHEQQTHDSIKNEIDLALAPARGKLLLIGQDDKKAIKPTGEVHALSGENIHAKPAHFRHSKYLLVPDVTRVLVRLAAENMPEQQFRFAIARNPEGRTVSISEIKP